MLKSDWIIFDIDQGRVWGGALMIPNPRDTHFVGKKVQNSKQF